MSVYKSSKRISNSPWLALQQVKSTLIKKIDEQNQLLDELANNDLVNITDAIDSTVTGASGRIYAISKEANSKDLTVKLRDIDFSDDTYKDVETLTISNYFDNEGLKDAFDSYIGESGLSLSGVLNDINDGKNFSTLLTEVTRSLQCSVTLSYSDISNIANEYISGFSSDISKLLSTVRSSLTEGKLTAQAWLSNLKAIFSSAEDALDGGSSLLDTSKPFAFQSCIAYVVEGIISVVSTIVSGLLAIVKPIVGIIAYGIFSIMTRIIQAFQSAEKPISSDNSALTSLLQGPVLFGSVTYDGWRNIGDSYRWFKNLNVDDGIACYVNGPFQHYAFMIDGDDRRYFNSFIAIQWNWRKFLSDMISNNYISAGTYETDGNTRRYYQWDQKRVIEMFKNPEYYYSAEDTASILANSDASLVDIYMSLVLYNVFGRVTEDCGISWSELVDGKIIEHQYVSYGSTLLVSHGDRFAGYLAGTNTIPTLYMKDVTGVTFAEDLSFLDGLLAHLLVYNGTISDSYSTLLSLASGANSDDNLQQAIINFYTNGVSWMATHTYGWSGSHQLGNTPPETTGSCSIQDGIIGTWMCKNQTLQFPEVKDEYILFPVDSMPPDRALSISGITTAQLEKELIIFAVVTTALTVAAIGISKYVKNRKILKRTDRANALKTARDNYTSNPTAENGKIFAKEVKKYNLKGKLFGWGSYDAANGWFDAATPSTAALSSSLLAGSDGSALTDIINNLRTGSPEGEVNNSANLNMLYSVITGR